MTAPHVAPTPALPEAVEVAIDAAREVLCLDDAATPSPWMWYLNPSSKSVRLQGERAPGWIVFDFARWGMNGAAPVFRNLATGILERIEHFASVIPGREHHAAWARDIDHPDARLIARYRALAPVLAREVLAQAAVTPRVSEAEAVEAVDAYDRAAADDLLDHVTNPNGGGSGFGPARARLVAMLTGHSADEGGEVRGG